MKTDLKNKRISMVNFMRLLFFVMKLINPYRFLPTEAKMHLNYLKITRIKNGVYFGRIHAAQQINPDRTLFMKKLITQEAQRKEKEYNIVEIGSWAGESAILWAEQLKKVNVNGKVICIDPWTLYDEIASKTHPKRSTRYRMKKATSRDIIFKLFLHNIDASGHDDVVRYFRGSSNDLLPLLRENFFDLVFIDGSHFYKNVKKDIENAMQITRDGGVICGDDLELQKLDLDPSIDLDKIRLSDGDTPVEYMTIPTHLGVTLAVWDTFKTEISSWNGFWAMRKVKNEYEKIILDISEGEVTEP